MKLFACQPQEDILYFFAGILYIYEPWLKNQLWQKYLSKKHPICPLAKHSLHSGTSVVAGQGPGRELVRGSSLPGMNSRCVLLQGKYFNFR